MPPANDTSGRITLAHPVYGGRYVWTDLSPFEQGYVEAVFASDVAGEDGSPDIRLSVCRKFSDLAPETLAAIRKDCDTARLDTGPEGLNLTEDEGAEFWADRQAGKWSHRYPPLTVSLGNDGKVYLREVA